MSNSPLSPENVSSLIDHVLKSKDPAAVGLRKILKKKEDEAKEFSYHAPLLKEFDVPGRSSHVLNDEERMVLELEKKVNALELKLKKQDDDAKVAIANAHAKGHDEGLTEGIEKGKNETTALYESKITDLQKKIALFLNNFETSKRAIFSNADHLILRLSLEMVKKILSKEIEVNKEIILNIIKNALSYIGDKEKIVIRIAPDDFETVSMRKDFWVPVTDRLKDIQIEADERIEKGGCIVESNSGVVDARLGVQFDELALIVETMWQNASSSIQSES